MIFDEHFEQLKTVQPLAESADLGNDVRLVAVPQIPLVPGWSKTSSTIWFIAPKGYSIAKPDCFWADADLKLANGGSPTNSGTNAPYPQLTDKLWFSWHLSTWNPSTDDLIAYLRFIQGRLREAR